MNFKEMPKEGNVDFCLFTLPGIGKKLLAACFAATKATSNYAQHLRTHHVFTNDAARKQTAN